MPRELESSQVGLYFFIGPALADSADDAEYAIQRKAYDLVQAAIAAVPGWSITENMQGEAVTIAPYELCELEVESEVFGARRAFSIWVYADGREIPLELAQAVKTLCLQQYQLAAGDLKVEFAQAKLHQVWRQNETVFWPEV